MVSSCFLLYTSTKNIQFNWDAFLTLSAIASGVFQIHNRLTCLTVFSLSMSLSVMNLSAGILTATVLVAGMTDISDQSCNDRGFEHTGACHWWEKEKTNT
jgi:hypothetical protein